MNVKKTARFVYCSGSHECNVWQRETNLATDPSGTVSLLVVVTV